jgi:hypothetical protein
MHLAVGVQGVQNRLRLNEPRQHGLWTLPGVVHGVQLRPLGRLDVHELPPAPAVRHAHGALHRDGHM